MSWAQGLGTLGGKAAGATTAAARTALFDSVARPQLFGPRGFQCAPEGLRVVRELRWQLLATGPAALKSSVVGHMLTVYGDAAKQMAMHGALPMHDSGRVMNPSVEAILVEQMQCLAEAKLHGVRLQPWHVRTLLRSPLLACVGPDLSLLVLNEVTHAQPGRRTTAKEASDVAPPLESVVDCATGLAGAGYASAAWELLAPYQHEARVASTFPGLVEAVLRGHVDGRQAAVDLVQQIPIDVFFSAPGCGGWVDGAARAYERHAKHGDDSVATAWLRRLDTHWHSESMKSASSSPEVSRAVLEAALRVAGSVADSATGRCHAWPTLVEDVLAHNARVAQQERPHGAAQAGMIPVAKLGRFLRRAGQPETYLKLVCGSAEDRSGQSLLARIAKTMSDRGHKGSDEEEVAAVYNEVILALAAARGRGWEMALALYEQWMRAELSEDVASPLPPAPTRATHWCVVQLILRPDARHSSGAEADGVRSLASSVAAAPPLTDATFRICREALRRAVGASTPGTLEGNNDTTLATHPVNDPDGLTESFVLWDAARGEWEEALYWAAHAPAQHCRYAQLIALAAAAQARTATLYRLANDDGGAAIASQAGVRSEEEAMKSMAGLICNSPHRTWKQLSLLTASLSTTLAVPVPPAAAYGNGDACLVTEAGHDAALVLHPCVLTPLVTALCACLDASQPAMDQLIQQTVEYYVSLRHRRQGGRQLCCRDEAWLAERVRRRATVLDGTLQLVAEATWAPRNAADGTDWDDKAEEEQDEQDWCIMAQVLREVSQQSGLSMARAAPAVVSAGLKADVALHFLA